MNIRSLFAFVAITVAATAAHAGVTLPYGQYMLDEGTPNAVPLWAYQNGDLMINGKRPLYKRAALWDGYVLDGAEVEFGQPGYPQYEFHQTLPATNPISGTYVKWSGPGQAPSTGTWVRKP